MLGLSGLRVVLALALAAISGAAIAQPADLPLQPATTSTYPPGVAVNARAEAPVYADARGRTLYGMDMRTVLRWSPNPALFCQAECQAEWEPLLAPADAVPNLVLPRGGGPPQAPSAGMVSALAAPDWSVIAGPNGPQWVYKGWHLVYTRRANRAIAGNEAQTWNPLRFVPPVPAIVAPPGVQAVLREGRYVLADAVGDLLVTTRCARRCPGLTPLGAGMASRGLGRWQVRSTGDAPQWTFGGAAVFVAAGAELPRGARMLPAEPAVGGR